MRMPATGSAASGALAPTLAADRRASAFDHLGPLGPPTVLWPRAYRDSIPAAETIRVAASHRSGRPAAP
jgi:hypothetical protein